MVKIKRTASQILINIEDNGKGFEIENIKSGGLGLVGLRERAQLLNGEFSIESKIGKGTRLELRLPLELPLELRL